MSINSSWNGCHVFAFFDVMFWKIFSYCKMDLIIKSKIFAQSLNQIFQLSNKVSLDLVGWLFGSWSFSWNQSKRNGRWILVNPPQIILNHLDFYDQVEPSSFLFLIKVIPPSHNKQRTHIKWGREINHIISASEPHFFNFSTSPSIDENFNFLSDIFSKFLMSTF